MSIKWDNNAHDCVYWGLHMCRFSPPLAAAHPPPSLGLQALACKSFDFTMKIETAVIKLGVVDFCMQASQ